MSNEVYNPNFIEVGDLIRKCRENASMTQVDLSEKAGFGEKTLSRLEMGKSNMRIDTFFALAAALGVTPNDISPSHLKAVKGDPLELAVILGAFYGLRRSEVIGLKWDAIDFERKTISIRHTVVQFSVDGKLQMIQKDSTKTKSSCRTLPLVAPFELLLRYLKAEQAINQKVCGDCYCKDYLDYIYVDAMGGLVKPNFITQHFDRLLKKHGLKKIRFHDLRHSCASLLYANGVPLKDIQEWLGHSDIGTTSNIYTHLDYSNKVSSANAIMSVYPNTFRVGAVGQ